MRQNTPTLEDLDLLRWDLRQDCVDIIMAGGGGHIGGDMSMMDALMVLYLRHLRVSPETVDDPNRDRFVLSKGHAMEAYYAVLCHQGFLGLVDVKARFQQFGSPYIGHPNNKLPGIEMNSGSLGHGLPVAVGMALAGSQEERWAAFGWNVLSIDGHDLAAIDAAITLAAETKGKPTCIILNTVKGYGSPVMEGKAPWHHQLPNAQEYAQISADFAARKEAALHA